ncbi:MAG: hypothetical protein JWM27_3200 [Gemmatimonadetes bacterium]|nr:hypothetical protein [Gemmatimonadota bacterium]
MAGGKLTQGELAAALRTRTDAADGRLRVLEGLDADALAWSPPGGGWSVGQVLEHLVVSADSYLDRLPYLLERSAALHGSADTPWKASLLGKWLAKSLEPGARAMPAPRIYRPGAAPRADVLAELLKRQARALELMEAAAGLEWRRVRMGSPVTPLIRLNLGDVFTVNVVHVERHLGQIDRVLAARGG